MKALITLTILATLTSATSFASVSHTKAYTIAKSEEKVQCSKKVALGRYASTSPVKTQKPSTAKQKSGVRG